MGSSTSKRRKGHTKPQHLPKVGTPANDRWERETRQRQVFGSGVTAAIIGVVLLLALIGVLIITL